VLKEVLETFEKLIWNCGKARLDYLSVLFSISLHPPSPQCGLSNKDIAL